MKRAWDPDNLFRFNANIAPARVLAALPDQRRPSMLGA